MDNIQIVSLIDKFLDFYDSSESITDFKEKFKIWEEKYGFAAVPPGDNRQETVYKLFTENYSKYKKSLGKIKKFKPNEEKVNKILNEIKTLLAFEGCLDFVIIYFVGFFENNAFVAPYDGGKLALCLPVENNLSELNDDILLAHELTHIVHNNILKSEAKWTRKLSFAILQEGLAMKTSQCIVPGLSEYNYLASDEKWFNECMKLKGKIIDGIISYLDSEDGEILFKFTIGEGTTKNVRELYIVAWVLFSKLLDSGFTLQKLANVIESDSVDLVNEYLSK